MGQHSIYVWIGFNLFVLAMLALDLGVFHRKSHRIGFREAMIWTVVWITLSLTFNLLIYLRGGAEPALAFLTGYVIEKSLSVDNIFVMLMIFTYFRVPAEYQHKVLFWGILGALFMRGAFILAGVTLIQKYHWVVFVFGGFLILSGLKMAMPKEEEVSLDKNFVLRLTKKLIPTTSEYEGSHFFVRKNGKRMATPLLAALVMVEFTDLIFAVDSIPAILAITPDAFLVYTSNVFAILGLRSLYFAVSGLMDLFHFLQYGLAAILTFVGIKMLLTDVYPIPTGIALGVIVGILSISIVASKIWPAYPSDKTPNNSPR
ncbi:MAG: TerC family protein [Bdellovibrionales bacterium]|nr:TerC family protein [Bdellovibrionales bacterium]